MRPKTRKRGNTTQNIKSNKYDTWPLIVMVNGSTAYGKDNLTGTLRTDVQTNTQDK